MSDQVRDDWRRHLETRLNEFDVPFHLHSGLIEYITTRRKTGDFLRAVLENDLRQAIGRAGPELFVGPVERQPFVQLVRFLNTCVPSLACGSPAAVKAWLTETAKPQPTFD